MTIRGRTRTRIVGASDFFIDALRTVLEPAILTELAVAIASERSTIAFHEHARRHGDFAVASAAAQLSPERGVLRAGLGALGSTPVLCKRIQNSFRSASLLAEWTIPSLRRLPTWMRCRISIPAPTTAADLPPSACPTASESWSREGTSETTVVRVEDRRLLTGHGRFVDDIHLDRMVHAAFVRSPHAHAELGTVNLEPAMKAGAVAAFAANDLPFIQNTLFIPRFHPSVRKVLPKFLATDRVRYVGEPVALIVAADRYAAEDFAALVEVDYRPLPPISTSDAALAADAPNIHDAWPGNVAASFTNSNGDADGDGGGAAPAVARLPLWPSDWTAARDTRLRRRL